MLKPCKLATVPFSECLIRGWGRTGCLYLLPGEFGVVRSEDMELLVTMVIPAKDWWLLPLPQGLLFLTDKNSASQGCRFEGYSWESELPSTSQESLSGSQPCNVSLLGSSRTFLGDFLVPSLFHSLETHIGSWNSSVAVWFVCPLIHQDLGLLRLRVLKASFSVFCQVLEIFLMGG